MKSSIRALASATALLAAGTLASSCFTPTASAQSGRRADCFRVQDITGISTRRTAPAEEQDVVNIKVFKRGYYQLQVIGPCTPQLQNSINIGVQSRSGSSYICRNTDAEVIAKDPDLRMPARCVVSNLRHLSDAEVASLPQGERP